MHIAIFLLASITFGSLNAQEITIPKIDSPVALNEGTQKDLSASQIAELLPWAKDSKIFLVDLLDNVQTLATNDKIDRLVEGIKQTVGESSPKNSELLMRYALNRGLVLNEILTKEMGSEEVGTADAKLRVLKSSIQMAIKYYDTDMAFLSKRSLAPYVVFGLDYFEFLTNLNKSVFDASAQYAIQRTSLEWLQWDLYRDLNNTSYAPQIVKINNALKTFSTKKMTDAQSIASIRQMKALAKQLNVRDVLTKLQKEKEYAEAKTEAERQAILKKEREEEQRRKDEQDRLERQRALEAINNGKPLNTTPIVKGDMVIHGSTLRLVEYTTDDQQVVLSYQAYLYNQSVARLNEVEKCYKNLLGFNEGSLVITNNTVRTVECVGERGQIVLKSVAYSYNQTFTSVKNVGKTVSSYQKFSVGDKVLFKGNVRTVQYLDDKGNAVLQAVSYSYNQDFATVAQLSKIN